MQLLDLELTADLGLTLGAFWTLGILSFRKIKDSLKTRVAWDWIIDGSGLMIQGLVVPLIISMILQPVLSQLTPGHVHSWLAPTWLAFLLPLTLVDYLYYWNHRLLHIESLWPTHRIHHSAKQMDILVTSRNSLITPLFIVYIWIHPVFLVLLDNWEVYLLGVAVSSSLDLWRHSGLVTPNWLRPLRWLLILPEDHGLHHSQLGKGKNYGANLSIWDRLHGTFKASTLPIKQFGENLDETKLKRMFWHPWIGSAE